MKAIVTLTALFCSVVFTFAQEGSGKSGASSRLAPASPVTQMDAGRGTEAPRAYNQVSAPALATAPVAAVPAGAAGTGEGIVGNLWELLEKGGWAMVPLGALSVLAVMLVVGFTFTVRRGMVVSKQYLGTVEVLIRKKD